MAGIITKAELNAIPEIVSDFAEGVGRLVRKADVVGTLGAEYASDYDKGYAAARRNESAAAFNRYQRAGKSAAFLSGFVTFQEGWKKWNDTVTRDGILCTLIDAEVRAEYAETAPSCRTEEITDEDDESYPTVTGDDGRTYAAASDHEAICPECGAVRSTVFIGDHIASEHDDDADDDYADEIPSFREWRLENSGTVADYRDKYGLTDDDADDEPACVFGNSAAHIATGCKYCAEDRAAGRLTLALRLSSEGGPGTPAREAVELLGLDTDDNEAETLGAVEAHDIAQAEQGAPPRESAYCTHPDCIDPTDPHISHGDH